MWILIRQKPGFGTLCNAIVIGLVFDLVNGWIGDRLLDAPFSLRMALLVGGIVLNGAATAAYLGRSEEHTSELQSLMRLSYAVFCWTKKKNTVLHKHKL